MPRIIRYTARRIQRLGFLKYIVSRTSAERPSSASSIGGNLLHTVSRKFTTSIHAQMVEYCDRVFSEQHYNKMRMQIQEAASQSPPRQVDLELQDIYLSQDNMPSKRGRILAEKDKDINIFPSLATSLGFSTSDTYVLTSRGKLFSNMVSQNEIDAFSHVSSVNPMLITPNQTFVLLFSFLQGDGDLIRMLYPTLVMQRTEFTDYEVGDRIGELMEDYLARMEKSAISMKDKLELSKLKNTNQKIKDWKGKKYVGVGARDEWATLRLEPYVDMGILEKPDKFAYKYMFKEGGRRFFSNILDGTIDHFLFDRYVNAFTQLFNIPASSVVDVNEALESLKRSNHILANNIGYSDIIDTCLLTASNLLLGGKILEINSSIQILKQAQKDNPYNIHFNIDRWGNLKFISFRKL